MSEIVETNQAKKRLSLRKILLLLAVISSPLGCCGCAFLLDVLPASLLPPGVNFIMNLFESEARIENRSQETLYLTPFTTTYGRPVVIKQLTFIRQRDIPLEPQQSMVLTYDAADMPLSGIAVCRSSGNCRLAVTHHSGVYYLDAFEDLPELEPDWLLAIQSQPQYSFEIVLIPMLSLLPIILFASWLYLGRLQSKRAG